MRKTVLGVAAVFIFMAIAVPGMAVAQTDSTSADTTTADQATDRAADRQARIDAYKERVTDRLTAAQERRLANACTAAQGKVTSLQNGLTAAIERRRSSYASVSEKLQEVVRKLQAASVDTAQLEGAITEMNIQAAAVVTAAEAYGATLVDLAEMDCEADPEGFQAALTVAREQRAALVAEAQALKDYVNGTIKGLLQGIRERLSSTTDGSEGS